VDLVSSHTDLSKRDVNRIVDQLEGQAAGDGPASPSARPNEWVDLISSLSARADENRWAEPEGQLMAESRSTKNLTKQQTTPGHSSKHSSLASTCSWNCNGADRSLSFDVQKILSSLATARDKWPSKRTTGQAGIKTPALALQHDSSGCGKLPVIPTLADDPGKITQRISRCPLRSGWSRNGSAMSLSNSQEMICPTAATAGCSYPNSNRRNCRSARSRSPSFDHSQAAGEAVQDLQRQ